jgi:molecular chaperone DnaK
MARVGLDFGTTYTVLSHFDKNGNLEAKEPAEGKSPLQPSIVARKNDKLEFGSAAKGRLGRAGVTIYTGFKMMLTEKDSGVLRERGYNQDVTPSTITTDYLNNVIAKYLERTQQDSIEKLVAGVPEIWFSNAKLLDCRKVLQDIFTGNKTIKEAQLVSEPAAACAYFVDNYKKNTGKDFIGRILLVDYGGGTLDIALCDVRQNGERSEVLVKKQAGAGENQEGIIGKAGLAFLEGVVKLALSKKGLSEKEIVSNQEFLECVDRFEATLIESSKEIKEIFDMNKLKKKETITDHFYDIEMNGEEYPITYGMMAEVYSRIISPVLEEKIREMIVFMDDAGIDHSVNTKDNFKIALVGGFCNFHLTQRQVENLLKRGSKDDRRFKDIIRDKSECEKAISYGAALIASNKIGFKQVAPYSLGIASEKGDKYFAIHIGDDITPNKPVFVNNGAIFAGKKIPRIAFNFSMNQDNAQDGEPLEKYKRILDLEPNRPIKLAFSFDESMIISLHKYVVDDIYSPNPKIVKEESVLIDDIYELLGGGIIELGGGKNV